MPILLDTTCALLETIPVKNHRGISVPAAVVPSHNYHKPRRWSVNVGFRYDIEHTHTHTHTHTIYIYIYIIRSQEKNLNQNRDSNLGPPGFYPGSHAS